MAGAQARQAMVFPPELERAFRLIVFDRDGTAVTSRSADATGVASALDRVLAAGSRAVIVTGTSFTNVARQLGRGVAAAHARRLHAAANRGSEVFGFDRRGEPTPAPIELGALVTPQYIDQPQHEWPAFSQELLARFLGAIGRCSRGVPARFFLRAGDPAREILRAATELDPDLIALVWHGGCEGEHGRVFRRVLPDAGLPVLVLRR